MFITIQNADLNSDLIKRIKVERKNITVTYVDGESCIFYFDSVKEARNTRNKLIELLNNEKSKRNYRESIKPTDPT